MEKSPKIVILGIFTHPLMPFGLPEETTNQILECLKSLPDIEMVKVFGSRAKGTANHNSDIDLVIFGDANINQIKYELEELPTPYKFDVVGYDSITNQALKNSIDTEGIIFYQKSNK